VGQIEGGLIQGLGFATMEELRRTDGRVETVSLADYKLPTPADLPSHEFDLLTDAPGTGPYGAKAIGELTNPLPPPAVANAVYHAVGARICTLPVTAERVRTALAAADPHGDAREALSTARPNVEFEAGLPEWREGSA
jgi:CO/xanthine dehydrogenase Mo-binding subunit